MFLIQEVSLQAKKKQCSEILLKASSDWQTLEDKIVKLKETADKDQGWGKRWLWAWAREPEF